MPLQGTKNSRLFVSAWMKVLRQSKQFTFRWLLRWGPLNSPTQDNDQFNDGSESPDKTSTDFVPPSEEEEGIYDDDLSPEERAIAEFCAIERKGWNSNTSVDDNLVSSNSRAGSVVSFTPSHERSIKRKKVQLNSPESRTSEGQYESTNSSQQVVYRKGQPTATPILL